jgi:hypothetical protein
MPLRKELEGSANERATNSMLSLLMSAC